MSSTAGTQGPQIEAPTADANTARRSRHFLAFGFSIILLSLAGLFLLRLLNLQADTARNAELMAVAEEQRAVYDMTQLARARLLLLQRLMVTRSREEAEREHAEFTRLASKFRSDLDEMGELLRTVSVTAVSGQTSDKENERREWEKLQPLIVLGRDTQDQAYALVIAGKWQEAARRIPQAIQIQNTVIEGLTHVYSASSHRMDQLVQQSNESLSSQRRLATILGSFAILMGIAVATNVWRATKAADAAVLQAMDHAIIANRHKSEFLARMTHELRSPLHVIMGYSQLLHEVDKTSHQESREYLGLIDAASNHLLALINNLLNFSKIEAGKTDLYAEVINVPSLVTMVCDMVRPLADKKSNTLATHVAADIPHMTTDSTKLTEILINLLSNAAKFTDRGRIALDVSRETTGNADWVLFRVADTGIGIPRDRLDAIFQPFTQAEDSTTHAHGGTGLGLTICSELTRMMGGSLSVESEPGRGSTFSVRLPVKLPLTVNAAT